MNDSNKQIMSIFADALACESPEARAAHLDRACGDDAAMRAEIEALLNAHEAAGDFLKGRELPADFASLTDKSPRETVGTVIGPYKLLEQIGEGGMGVVYMADQQTPVRRRVAVKIIKPGMDSRKVIARFEAERQALALMDHTNIARVLDAGATDLGRPYFVMELVRGIPITEYCDEKSQPIPERLELFVQVCHAVQHAHQKGIIHRDLKPNNVLVTMQDGRAIPKIIDFGVAKATGQQLTEKTLFTAFAQMVGTPLYMSPEQAEMASGDIDTRSDIYSLGVMLYELLTGTTPFEQERLRTAAFDEIRRIIREEEPPHPSARLSTLEANLATTIAERHRTDPRRLSQTVRGELDWIAMTCLEKDRNRRYESAGSLAQDIQRHLNDEPVQACPPSLKYRLRKFARRKKTALTIGALLAVILLTIAVSTGWAIRERLTRQAAVESRVLLALEEATTAYRDDKLTDAFAAIKQAEGLLGEDGGNTELPKRVAQWRHDLDLANRLDEIRIERAGVSNESTNDSGAASADGEEILGFNYRRTDSAYSEVFRDQGWDVETENIDVVAARMKQSLIRNRLTAALDDWAITRKITNPAHWTQLLKLAGRIDDDPWRARLRKAAVASRSELFKLTDVDAVRDQPVTSVILLARMLVELQEIDLAIHVLRAAHGRNPDDFWLNNELGVRLLASDLRQPVDALSYLRAAVALRPQSAVVRCNLAEALTTMNRFAEAAEELRTAESLRPRPHLARVHQRLGHNFMNRGENAKAMAEFRAAVQIEPENAIYRRELALAMRSQLRYIAEAEAEARAAIKMAPDLGSAHYDLGLVLENQGNLDEAAAEYLTSLDVTTLGQSGTLRNGARFLQGVLRRQDRLSDAEQYWRERLTSTSNHRLVLELLSEILVNQCKCDDAESLYREAGTSQLDDPRMLYRFGDILFRQRKLAEAESVLRRSLELRPGQWDARLLLAQVMINQGKLAEADAIRGDVIIARDPTSAENLVDLSPYYNAGLSVSWHVSGQLCNNLHALPQGIQTLDKTQFDVRGIVQLRGGYVCSRDCPWYPEQVSGLVINRRFERIHFLHATVSAPRQGTLVGNYVIRYADGQKHDIPLAYNENIYNWYHGNLAKVRLKGTTIAWTFSDKYAHSSGGGISLYKFSWENPRPDREIATIDFTSTMTNAAPFLVAITGEP